SLFVRGVVSGSAPAGAEHQGGSTENASKPESAAALEEMCHSCSLPIQSGGRAASPTTKRIRAGANRWVCIGSLMHEHHECVSRWKQFHLITLNPRPFLTVWQGSHVRRH